MIQVKHPAEDGERDGERLDVLRQKRPDGDSPGIGFARQSNILV